MSIEIMNRVWNHSQQQGTKLVLLLALADMANTSGYCWPSLETLQKRARLSRYQNVIKAITEIEADAEVWVERSRGRSHSNNYIVTVGMNAEDLAKTLITHFDYAPADAMQKANEFLKRSPQDTLSKRSPQDENVVPEIRLSEENVVHKIQNVVPEILKRSPQTTRSVIEPSIETKTTSATRQSKKSIDSETAESEQQKKLVKDILAAYVEVRGSNGINYAKEGAWAKKIAKEGATIEMVKSCYEWIKLDKFWEYKPVSLAKVCESLPEFKRFIEKRGMPKVENPAGEWVIRDLSMYEGGKMLVNTKTGEKRKLDDA